MQHHLAGKLPTHTRGTGTTRVEETQPIPLPQCTLPVTHAGFKTCDNHYLMLTITQYPSLVIRVPSVWKWYNGIGRYNSPL